MSDFIADAYVVFWKHFQRQGPNDIGWMASATCGLSGCIAVLNVAQLVAFALGKNLGALYFPSKLGQLLVGAVAVVAGVGAMKIFLSRQPALQTREGVTARYDQISSAREATIVILAFANLVGLLVVHQMIAR